MAIRIADDFTAIAAALRAQGPALGDGEGETCNLDGCPGTLEFGRVENCSCHIAPPCGACVSNPLVCTGCYREIGGPE
jgi:hypothetical protein